MERAKSVSNFQNTNDHPAGRIRNWFAKALNRSFRDQRHVAADAVAYTANYCRKQAENLLAGRYSPQFLATVAIVREYDDPWLALAILADRLDTLTPEMRAEAEKLKAELEAQEA